MKKEKDYSWCSSTMEKLKQKVIVDHLSEIDLDNEIDLYDRIMTEFADGSLDEVFESPVCIGLEKEKKQKLLAEGRKYLGLCFSRGDISRWVESIEGITLGDYELICMKIFENYNFVLKQLKNDRANALDRLAKFKNYGFGAESSIIECLRYSFYDEDALDAVLSEMSDKDGKYARFSDEHMSILCSYPEGLLYSFDENKKPVMHSISDIQVLINSKMEELNIDDADDNYFKKVAAILYMEYTDEFYSNLLEDTDLQIMK